MFIPAPTDAPAFTDSSTQFQTSTLSQFTTPSQASTQPQAPIASVLPSGHFCPEYGRHMLFGTPAVVQSIIHQLHHIGYAEPNDWSRPMSTGRPNEVMAILTKRVSLR